MGCNFLLCLHKKWDPSTIEKLKDINVKERRRKDRNKGILHDLHYKTQQNNMLLYSLSCKFENN